MFQKKINPNEKILRKLKKVDKKWVIVVDSGQKRMYNEPTLRIGELKTRRKRMKRLYGTYEHQLDDKNRIRIPAKFLAVFDKEYEGEPLYFVIYTDGRIAIMPESVLDERTGQLKTLLPDETDALNALSKILGTVEEVNKDGQGRAIIPKFLRNEVRIEKDVVTVGMGDYIEIWAKQVRSGSVDSMSVDEANKKAYGRARELAGKS